MSTPEVTFEHVQRLSDDVGIFEHAEGATPRRHLGYCLDDVARGLVVVARQPDPTPLLGDLMDRYLAFVIRAQAPDGRCHNRLGLDRRWTDEAGVDDCWGRALWGLGTAAARAGDDSVRRRSSEAFALSARWRSQHRRAMTFAALGAAEVLTVAPDDAAARALLAAAVRSIGRPTGSGAWPWPEARLTYANAALPEVLLAAGEHLGDARALDDGLRLLGWLVDLETRDSHLSVTPVGGWSLGEHRPGFDQQPIEVAALADACARAQRLSGDVRWAQTVDRAVGWFLGDNDAGIALYEPSTGGGCDGLHADARNENQGAESTLAMIATLQHARARAVVTPKAAVDVRRSGQRLRPDPSRVLAKLFIPGQEGVIEGESRAGSVVDRVLKLDDDEAAATLAEVVASFSGRHTDLGATLDEHFELVSHRIEHPAELSTARRRLVGAYFTQEYAVESAAICNPSIVPHPDQSELSPGDARFVMSLRAVGEGHRSSIEFRTGVIAAGSELHFDVPGAHLSTGRPGPSHYRRDLFRRVLRSLGDHGTSAAFVLDSLPDPFTGDELEQAIGALHDQLVTRRGATETIDRIRWVASSNYEVTFPTGSSISERVLSPTAPIESNGMEDARFVRFVDDDGVATYFATYTAYDGTHVGSQLLSTVDFRTFTSTQLTGRGARNKGMALFPRRIGGRYVALSRWDRETNAIVTSDDPTVWDDPVGLQRPAEPWDLIQLGNCGSPIESPAGWIMLTHGVGPMRRYAIGAELLDLDDPTRVIGHLREPLLTPAEDERDGYVPNVVYSCGAMLHGDTIVLPYGMSDANVGVATISLRELLDRLT